MEGHPLETPRLELVLATGETARAAADGDLARLAGLLRAEVPPDWPPEHVEDALPHVADELERAAPRDGIGMYFIVLRKPRTLIGTCGMFRPPRPETIVVGYSIIRSQQRRGYATETTRRLVAHAFSLGDTQRVMAETLPGHRPSIGVLEKLGFRLCEEHVRAYSGEADAIRYELLRPAGETRV
jgi:RimJ/RimL family protein N-acetyltransferase